MKDFNVSYESVRSITGMAGCYLIHFEKPVAGSRHYLGYASNIRARFEAHLMGKGSNLTKMAVRNGVKLTLVRVWTGAPALFEQELKKKKNLPRLCFCCPNTEERACPAE